jgi:hypothetical protein
MSGLPQKFAIRFIEGHDDTTITRFFRIFQRFIIRSDKNFSTRNDWTCITLRSEFCNPFDIFAALDIPGFRNALLVHISHISGWSIAEHRNFILCGKDRQSR